ncbi:hypothetical protein Pmar_PMAR027670 [Perkinsus marinus ATCC 50983]|uniref:Uncharacterized protein n=1 Tax=Perkinsus marinus (strain ATCC 50983 / TXsc) TaxID=423536 RepID=C5LFW9_PERM5|nr:hypothetical protein Pmar_PMAR027670 [Perkinsus marinus ATCC 50983]EER04374.1 hypothetical protein Pmar_PMAR027670 [Perkinsus marinus ATCC 50983]|eukprot:XP_002772558.1 hypothetical protein Pmar_PMAR027670 [Perkinsus marinus ATCC 50983]
MKFIGAIIVAASMAEAGSSNTLLFPEEDPLYYCHSDMTWGDIPSREDKSDAKPERVVVFGRHGARVLTRDLTCWEGDDTEYMCPVATYYGFINSPSEGQCWLD